MNSSIRVSAVTASVALLALAATMAGCEQSQFQAQTVELIAPEGAIDYPIICVSDVASHASAHAGRVAVRGVVSKVFEKRRALTVANIVEGATCCASGCGHDSVPAHIPAEQYDGELPELFQRVILVGELVPNGESYEFIIEEIWAGGAVKVKKRAG